MNRAMAKRLMICSSQNMRTNDRKRMTISESNLNLDIPESTSLSIRTENRLQQNSYTLHIQYKFAILRYLPYLRRTNNVGWPT